MINNIDIIKLLLDFSNEDNFYFCQIIKRKKEHPELGSNSYIVKTYYIKKLEEFDFYFGEIKCLCEYHNARAYIDLNRRSFEKLAFQNLKKVTDQILQKDYRSVRKSYNSVCGMYSAEKEKNWIIDIDTFDINYINEISNFITNIEPIGSKVIVQIPTKNGIHLITKPFNLDKFKKQFNDIEVHRNNPTLLFIP